MTTVELSRARLVRQYGAEAVNAAQRQAKRLMAISQPTKLAYQPDQPKAVEQARRVILMGARLRESFLHLYATTPQESQRAFDRGKRLAAVLSVFPTLENLEDNKQFRFVVGSSPLVIEEIAAGGKSEILKSAELPPVPPENQEARSVVSGHALINYMYDWSLGITANRPRNFRLQNQLAGFTISSNAVIMLMKTITENLAFNAVYFQPILFFVVDSLLIHPETELPFNIDITH